MKNTKILWCSRHQIDQQFKEELLNDFPEANIVQENITFSLQADEFDQLVREYKVIAGVFPAQVQEKICFYNWQAGREVCDQDITAPDVKIISPISEPFFAEDGTQRGFKFSHSVVLYERTTL